MAGQLLSENVFTWRQNGCVNEDLQSHSLCRHMVKFLTEWVRDWATSVHSNKADSPSCVHTLESYVFELIVSQKARFCRAFAGRKYHYASVSFSPMQSEIRIGSLAVKSWRNRVLQTKNLGFRTAERSVPEPRDKSSMSFHSFKRRAGCWRGFGEENRDRGRWRGGGTGAGLIQMHHCQAARTHTHTQAHNEGPKGQQCLWFNYDEIYASDVDSTQVRTGKTGCHQSVSNGLPQLGHLLNCTHTHAHTHTAVHNEPGTHILSTFSLSYRQWSVCAIASCLLSCDKLTLIQGKKRLSVFNAEFTRHTSFRICVV